MKKPSVYSLGLGLVMVFASLPSGYNAFAQSSENSSLLLRGTAGEGVVQSPVFSQPYQMSTDSDADRSQDGSEERDTSDPLGQLDSVAVPTRRARQVQGRARRSQAQRAVMAPLQTTVPSTRSNVAAAPSQTGVARGVGVDPFAALGLRIGSWRAYGSLEQTLGYSSNPAAVALGDPGAFTQTDVSLSLQSDWSRHSARIDVAGSYRNHVGSEIEDLPTADVEASLNLDLVDGLTAEFTAGYAYATEAASSSTITSAVSSRPGVHSSSASARLRRSGRKFLFSLRGGVARTDYENLELTDGSEQSQDDRNNTYYSLIGRAGYHATPAFTPYLEGEIGRRIFDEEIDRNGDQRDANVYAARVGVEVDLSEKLIGDVSLGYRVEDYEGDNLDNLEGITMDGSLTWSPVRDTSITLTSQTSFSGLTTGGQNGSLVQTFGLAASRQVTDRLLLEADAGVEITQEDDGSRTDYEWTIGTGFSYSLSRYMALIGSLDHTTVESTNNGSSYNASSIRGGIRFQR